jgi:hypothetical protein
MKGPTEYCNRAKGGGRRFHVGLLILPLPAPLRRSGRFCYVIPLHNVLSGNRQEALPGLISEPLVKRRDIGKIRHAMEIFPGRFQFRQSLLQAGAQERDRRDQQFQFVV